MKKHPAHGAHRRARALRQNMTIAERQVWQILRSRQIEGHKFRRQAPIGPYIADFVWHEVGLIVEIDGGQHDRSSSQETERTKLLQDEGYRILRLWNNEILENIDGTRETIACALAASPPPGPPPSRGRVWRDGRPGARARILSGTPE